MGWFFSRKEEIQQLRQELETLKEAYEVAHSSKWEVMEERDELRKVLCETRKKLEECRDQLNKSECLALKLSESKNVTQS